MAAVATHRSAGRSSVGALGNSPRRLDGTAKIAEIPLRIADRGKLPCAFRAIFDRTGGIERRTEFSRSETFLKKGIGLRGVVRARSAQQ
jgi:hypothetical protein